MIRRNLQSPHDFPASKATEKGIDVAIAVDMIPHALSGLPGRGDPLLAG